MSYVATIIVGPPEILDVLAESATNHTLVREKPYLLRFIGKVHPYEGIAHVTHKFDDVIHVMYASSDLGFGVGEYWMQNGVVVRKVSPKAGSSRAYRFADAIHRRFAGENTKKVTS